MQSSCIICLTNDHPPSVEHIVPRALGNIHYILPKGVVCQRCNNRFAKSENAVLNSTEWYTHRESLRLIGPNSTIVPCPIQEHHLTRLLVKMYYESLYHSRHELWHSIYLEPIRGYLDTGQALKSKVYSNKKLSSSQPIPRLIDRWRLRANRIELSHALEKDQIHFSFTFSNLHYLLIINELQIFK
jgi:hypothetical protein